MKGRRLANVIKLSGASYVLLQYGVSVNLTTGPSMYPSIYNDWLLMDLYSHPKDYKVGDVIALINPIDRHQRLCKRVKGLPGDVIRFRHPQTGFMTAIELPAGHIWVEGDNTQQSIDSRYFGPVPLGLATGRLLYQMTHKSRYLPSPKAEVVTPSDISRFIEDTLFGQLFREEQDRRKQQLLKLMMEEGDQHQQLQQRWHQLSKLKEEGDKMDRRNRKVPLRKRREERIIIPIHDERRTNEDDFTTMTRRKKERIIVPIRDKWSQNEETLPSSL
ncbi:IMP1 inner mitochondrial membrane peptidase-like [Balamuthia mandrillaris]